MQAPYRSVIVALVVLSCRSDRPTSYSALGAGDLLSAADLNEGLTGYGSTDTAYVRGDSPRSDTAATFARVALWRVEGHQTDDTTLRLLCAALVLGVTDSSFHRLGAQVFDALNAPEARAELLRDAVRQWPTWRWPTQYRPIAAWDLPPDDRPFHGNVPHGCMAILDRLR